MKVVIINGAGGAGKDTFVTLLRTYCMDKYEIKNLSTITSVKEIATTMGWKGEKDNAGRAFLADLKRAWKSYNNGPVKEVMKDIANINLYEEICDKECIVFIHCREQLEIKEFVELFKKRKIIVRTLLIKRDGIEKFFNSADLNTDTGKYDYTIWNNGTIEELSIKSEEFLKEIEKWN